MDFSFSQVAVNVSYIWFYMFYNLLQKDALQIRQKMIQEITQKKLLQLSHWIFYSFQMC